MKKFVVILLLYSSAFINHGMKLAEFEDIYKPSQIVVSGNDIYVVDGETIKLFSIKNMELKKMIGEKGEGPGEFKMAPTIQLFPDLIFVSDYGKILYFKRNGEFIYEKKISTDINLEKVQDNYLSARDDYRMDKGVVISTFSILDKNFNEFKTLYSTSREFKISYGADKKRDMKLFEKVKQSFTDGEYIYVTDTHKGFYFEILDHTGKLLNTVNRKTKKIRISNKYKKDFMTELQESSDWIKWGSRYNHIFPEYFPAFSHLEGDKNRIYVYSQVDNNKNARLTIFDRRGNFQKMISIPRGDRSTVNNEKFYYMIENEDDEVWELHSVDL